VTPEEQLFVFIIIFFVVLFKFEGDDFAGCRFGEIEAFRGGFGCADYIAGGRAEVELRSVDGGELESIEQGCGAFDLDLAGSNSVDDDGESDLDGLAVFEGGEFEVLAGYEVTFGGFGVAKAGVALVETGVEVAPDGSGEGRGLAAQSVGLDVAAE
jgi:hypothetical protein